MGEPCHSELDHMHLFIAPVCTVRGPVVYWVLPQLEVQQYENETPALKRRSLGSLSLAASHFSEFQNRLGAHLTDFCALPLNNGHFKQVPRWYWCWIWGAPFDNLCSSKEAQSIFGCFFVVGGTVIVLVHCVLSRIHGQSLRQATTCRAPHPLPATAKLHKFHYCYLDNVIAIEC